MCDSELSLSEQAGSGAAQVNRSPARVELHGEEQESADL
jgi:hypothetical protein